MWVSQKLDGVYFTILLNGLGHHTANPCPPLAPTCPRLPPWRCGFRWDFSAPTVWIFVWKKWVEHGIFCCLNSDVFILSDEMD